MTTSDTTTATIPHELRKTESLKSEASPHDLKEPYVGLRPFESHERRLFFGRERDAQFLCDKIFASRLTLLYGQSGLGKSSLIRALVIPELEQDDARVVYFDAWAGDNPADDLKSALIDIASELTIPHAGQGAPTIAELVRLIASVDRRTFVLILDQFEEFLVRHGDRLDPLKRELAALVRAPSLNVHTVLALREEFLAALDPFHRQILNLYQSTYRLEPLSDEAVRDAIQEPVTFFGAVYEPALIDALARDLRGSGGKGGVADTAPVDLPMLQLVCSQIWKAKKRGRTIKMSLYREGLGGRRKILDDYVRQVMPRRWARKRLVARLLNFLAPPSGFKISYSAGDLAEITNLDSGKINEELARLSRARILRIRKYRDAERYEIQHDALIDIVRPWRNEVLRRARRLRRAGWVFGGALSALLLGVGLYYFQIEDQLELQRNTVGALEELRSMPADQASKLSEIRFDSATAYLLWQRDDPGRFDLLRKMLAEFEDLMPEGYGIDTSGLGSISLTELEQSWPLTVHYSANRDLNRWHFSLTWELMSQVFAADWGIPVPQRVRFVEDPALPEHIVRITAPGTIDPLELRMGSYEDRAFINAHNLPQPTQDFFNHFEDEWEHMEWAEYGGPWYVVPRWSLPVWKVSGHDATDGSGLVAFRFALELQDTPDLLFSEPAVRYLLDRIGTTHPQTVAEAQRARGTRLGQDLAAIVRQGRDIRQLPVFLDALAQYPDKTPEDAVAEVGWDLASGGWAMLPLSLHGPWTGASGVSSGETDPNAPVTGSTIGSGAYEDASVDSNTQALSTGAPEVSEAYEDLDHWLPPMEPEIRLYIGADLVADWTSNGLLSPSLVEVFERVRDDLWGHFGVGMPSVQVHKDPDLPADAFRIVILNETPQTLGVETVQTSPDKALPLLTIHLTDIAETFRIYWLTPETVRSRRDNLSKSLVRWLEETYSLTDLKLLMRGVVTPEFFELDRRVDGHGASHSVGHTLRYDEWILGSLVFWSRVDDPLDPFAMTGWLRETQSARFGRARTSSDDPIRDLVRRGIDFLRNGEITFAEEVFDQALARDSVSAINGFLEAYPEFLQADLLRRIDDSCRDPTNARWLQRETVLTIRERLAGLEPQSDAEELRRLRLCLFAHYASQSLDHARDAIARELISVHGAPDDWPADEAIWFAQKLLEDHDPRVDGPNELEPIEGFLWSGLDRTEEEGARHDAFVSLLEECGAGRTNRWCRQIVKEIAERHPDGWILLDLGWFLSGHERRDDLEHALGVLDRAEAEFERIELVEEERARILDVIRYARGAASEGLAVLGDEGRWADAEAIFTSLLESQAIGELAHGDLVWLRISLGQQREAEELVGPALEKWPTNPGLNRSLIWIRLHQGDAPGARAAADDLAGIAGGDTDLLFVAALGQLLTGGAGAEEISRRFLETDHPYVPYISMILYATMADQAKANAERVLERIWHDTDPQTWDARLRAGDPGVWREMLIGYYMDEVDRQRIFSDLVNPAAFEASSLSGVGLPYTGMQCEAHFYDAMLAWSRNEPDRMRTSLRQVISSNHRSYLEYGMAAFLLAAEDELFR